MCLLMGFFAANTAFAQISASGDYNAAVHTVSVESFNVGYYAITKKASVLATMNSMMSLAKKWARSLSRPKLTAKWIMRLTFFGPRTTSWRIPSTSRAQQYW